MPLIDVPTIHAVTDPRILQDPGFLARAQGVFEALGPAGALHLRGPGVTGRRLFDLATRLQPFADATGCRLVINDRVDIAVAAGAWGAQLGRRSMHLSNARKAGPALALGASVHTIEDVATARSDGADWVIAGHVFATPSHAAEPPRGIGFIARIASVGPPVVAIGGILPVHVAPLLAAGAHGVAVIRGIWESPDPGGAARTYLQAR